MPSNENADTIGWMAENAQRLLDDEVRRADSFRSRGGQIAVFAGTVFALLAGLIPDGLQGAPCFALWLATALFVGSSLLLLASVFVAIVRIVYPQERVAIAPAEIANYLTPRFTTANRSQVQKRTVRALHRSMSETRQLNKEFADALRLAGYLFLAGLTSAVGTGITLAIGALFA